MSDHSKKPGLRHFAHELHRLSLVCDIQTDVTVQHPITVTLSRRAWDNAMDDELLRSVTFSARHGAHDWFIYCGVTFRKKIDTDTEQAQ